MALVTQVFEVLSQASRVDRVDDLLIRLPGKPDPESATELGIFGTLVRQHFPQRIRIAVRGEKTCVGDVEILVKINTVVEVILIETVGYQLDRSRSHLPEILLDHRRDRDNPGSAVKDLLLKLMMLCLGFGCQAQMLEIKHLCPRVAEISHPWDASLFGQGKPDEMHTLRGTCRHYHIDRMIFQIRLEEPY